MQTTLIDPKIILQFTRQRIDIDTLVEKLVAAHAFPEVEEDAILLQWRKSQVRRAVKSLKNEHGIPLIFSIVDVEASGQMVRKYKQEALFNMDDYKQVIEYCRERGSYWRKLEKYLLRSARDKFGEQAQLFG
jgi:hypothetical protein